MVVSPSFRVSLQPQTASKLQEYQGPAKVRLGVRPENVKIGLVPADDSVKAAVHLLEPQGERTILTARLAAGELFLVEVAPEFQPKLEDTVYLQFHEPIHIFETERCESHLLTTNVEAHTSQ